MLVNTDKTMVAEQCSPELVSRAGGCSAMQAGAKPRHLKAWSRLFRAAVATAAIAATPVTAFEYAGQSFEVGGRTWQLKLPAGHVLEHLVEMQGPRLVMFDSEGALLAGSRVGRVYRIEPPYTRVSVYAELSDFPHSVALRDGILFVAKNDGVHRAPYRPGGALKGALKDGDFTLVAALPSGGGHSSRSVGVGPDRRLYASLGISGNCSDQYLDGGYRFQDRRGGVFVLVEQGGKPYWKPYASGLRNPIGFDWHPRSGVLYASNHGPDHHGYEQPPEYFARLDAGSFHGMPWLWFDGREVRRDGCIGGIPPREDTTPPVATFPARNGPMGVAFSTRDQGIVKAGDAAVALHGSWATRPHGGFLGDKSTRRPPWVALVRFNGDKASDVVTLIGGFQNAAGERLARPVGVAFGRDGALYFTSDGGALEGLFRLRAGHEKGRRQAKDGTAGPEEGVH